MNNSTDLHNFMEVGIVQFMIFPECILGTGPIVETVSILAEDTFFSFLELGNIDSPTTRKQIVSILSQAQISVEFDGQPFTLLPGFDLEAESSLQRCRAIDAMKQAIDQAAELGSPTCGVMSGKFYPRNISVADAVDRLQESLLKLCHYAQQYDITMCLENFDQEPYSKDCLVGPTSMAAELACAIKSEADNFGLLPDLSHVPILKETPTQMVEAAKDHIVRTQIGNGSADPYCSHYGDNHPYFGAPGTGVGIPQLTEFLQALVDVGFLSETRRGRVAFEVKPAPQEDPMAIIAGSKRALVEAWKQVRLARGTAFPGT